MKVPPLWFCSRKPVTNIALSTPVLGYKPSWGDGGSYPWAPFEDHYISLTSQGVQCRFFPGDDPSVIILTPGLNFGDLQTETSVSLCCFKPYIILLCFQLAISPCILWLGCFTHGKKVFSACLLLPTVFRDKDEENHKPALHKVNQLCIEY